MLALSPFPNQKFLKTNWGEISFMFFLGEAFIGHIIMLTYFDEPYIKDLSYLEGHAR